jgi:hypothetical protein
LILTKGDSIWCWGSRELIATVFGSDLLSINERDLPSDLGSPHNLYVKGFVEEALCKALARGKPLRPCISRYNASLVAEDREGQQADLRPLSSIVGTICGTVPGILAPVTEDHPVADKVTWAEAVRIAIDFKDGRLWLLLEPDIWIEPSRARKVAVAFLDARRGDRYNKKFNELLDAWLQIVFGTAERNLEIALSAFEKGTGAENPSFLISSRTAFARRHSG